MDEVTTYQITVLISMFFINILVVGLMWLNAKSMNKDLKFNVKYVVYAIFGVILGYNWFVPSMSYSGTLLDTFMASAAYALSSQYLVEKGSKAGNTFIKKIGERFDDDN
jgi:hypothetical protein